MQNATFEYTDALEAPMPEMDAVRGAINSLGISPYLDKRFIDELANHVGDTKGVSDWNDTYVLDEFFGLRVTDNDTWYLKGDELPYIATTNGQGTIAIHEFDFYPTVLHGDQEMVEYNQSTHRNEKDFLGKQDALSQALLGSLGYIIFVEAGLISRPDVIEGYTNHDMAVIAEKFGLKRFSTWQKEQLSGESTIPVPDQKQVEEALELLLNFNGGTLEEYLDAMSSQEDKDHYIVTAWALTQALKSIEQDSPLYRRLKSVIDKMVVNRRSNYDDVDANVWVFGQYAAFKDSVVDYLKHNGHKIVERNNRVRHRILGVQAVHG